MTKVLLVEPDKMLRHALAVALFPEFAINVMSRFPDAVPSDIDAVIIDTAALHGRESQAIIDLPVVCLDKNNVGGEAAIPRSVRLTWPLTREALRNAVAECLSAGARAKSDTPATTEAQKAAVPTARKGKKEASPKEDRFIELVDVVEEPNPS